MIQQLTKQTPQSLVEAQARADALFLSIGVGAIATNEQGNIYRVNDVAVDILGYSKSELLNKWYPKAVDATYENGEVVPVADRPITKAFLTGKPVAEKIFYKAKSGKKIPVSVTCSPIMLHGKPIGAVEVFYDSTFEDEVDRMKSEFISIASHQLRTPLAAINTYAGMLSSGYEGELSQGQQAHMQIIMSAVERMNNLISTLLDVSKLESGAISVRFKETDLASLLEEIIDELEQFAINKNIDLSIDYPKEPLQCYTDPLLVGEIYTNLISNAIKYTPEKGKVDIRLTIEGEEVVFQVKDTGYGIPEDVQGQVFSKFFRANNIKNTEATGTGLGLYMVKQVVEVLGGRLWFESEEGKGSAFYVALPHRSAPELPDAN